MALWSDRFRRSVFPFSAVVLLVLFSVISPPTHADDCEDIVLTAPDPVPGEGFGKSMAIQGTTLVVGAPGDIDGTSPFPGRVLVYELDDGEWEFQAELTAAGIRDGSFFGAEVAIDGDYIAVGSPRSMNDKNQRTGAVFLYERSRIGWQTQQWPDAVMYAPNTETQSLFGSGLALDGEWLFVGAPLDGEPRNSGVAHIFRYQGNKWREHQTITRPEPVKNEHFGYRIDVENGLAVIGAPNLVTHTRPGTAHVFMLDKDHKWKQMQTLSAGDEREAGDHFGRFVSLDRAEKPDDNWILVGSTGDDDHGEHSGSAYLFKVEEGPFGYRFELSSKVTAGSGLNGDHFGFSGEVRWPFILVGAVTTDHEDARNAGSAFIFEQGDSRGGWEQRGEICADCRGSGDRFGTMCRFYIDPDEPDEFGMLFGVPGDDPNDIRDAGAVHVIAP